MHLPAQLHNIEWKKHLCVFKTKAQKLTHISDSEVRKEFNKQPIYEQQKLQSLVSFGSLAQGWASLWVIAHKIQVRTSPVTGVLFLWVV